MKFLDCEASSLDPIGSYPIEVAWGDTVTGIVRAYLIDPTWIDAWTDWFPDAQAVHGLSRAELRANGLPPRQVAEAVTRELAHTEVWVTAMEDKEWVDELTMRALGTVASIRWRDGYRALLELAGNDHQALGAAWEAAWAELERQGIRAHRAGNDVRHLMTTRRILKGG